MKSDYSMEPLKFKSEETWPGPNSVQQKRSDPEPSCVSMKSDFSMDLPLKFESGDTWPGPSSVQQSGETRPGSSSVQPKRSDPEPSCVSMKSDFSMDLPLKFESGDTCPGPRSVLSPRPVVRRKSVQSMNQPQDLNDDMDPGFSHDSKLAEVLNKFRANLIDKCQCLCEGTSKQGNPTLLNEIYTELYITESESGEISHEHEVRQIETQSRRTTEDTPIKCNDIFNPLPGQDKPIRSVLTKGVAGIGKTVSVQKFILDWAEGKENQDMHLIFPLPFRELNLMKDQKLSLLELLHVFFPETKEMEISSGEYKVLFIFDGLDECRLQLNFHNNQSLSDVRESASVDVLLTNLIGGNLLSSALIWITSRPAAANKIPPECVDRVTEVRGFSNPQKEEYFRKRISDENLANRVITHLKSSRSLYIMCHIPVFCWISATVLERMLSEAESEGEIPKTLTQMYTHFLIIQTNIKHQKDYEKKVKDEDMIFKLGKLAYKQLVKGNVIFYDEDLRECGIDVAEASVYSGLCTQIFREEFGLYQGKVFCFVHLSIQEHLAALYVHLSLINNNKNVFNKITKLMRDEELTICVLFRKIKYKVSKPNLYHRCNDKVVMSELHQKAIDKTLESKNGCFDLFLRFLLGLSLESNIKLLQNLMTQTGDSISHSNEKTVEYIKQKIRENPSPEKSINLFHCLNELGDHSLVEEIQHYMKSRTVSKVELSSSQWSALVFVLLTSEQELNNFNLNTFVRGNKAETLNILQKLLPVIQESRSVQLWNSGVTDEGCALLASALRSNSSNLRELDVSDNKIGDSGVKLLFAVLESSHCKLEELELYDCNITEEGCAALASALKSNPSHLRVLDISANKIGDSGVELLSAVLEDSHCKLKILRLSTCGVTVKGFVALASVLRSNPSHLKELDLSNNKLGDSGVKLLSAGLENRHCKLKMLRLNDCNITAKGCAALASALRSNPSHLRELKLSWNNLGNQGVKLLSAVMEDSKCKLEILRLYDCNITDEGCVALASALRSNPSHLTLLNLSKNGIGDSGVKLLSAELENPHCKLGILKLRDCGITMIGCVALASALRLNPSHLTELDLSHNKLGDSGVKLMSYLKDDPHYKLTRLLDD